MLWFSNSQSVHFLLVILIYFTVFSVASAPVKNQIPTELASVFNQQQSIENYWISEKLDGIRARWDGKHLFTRQGNRIYAPAWFTEGFPDQVMDGELWTGRQNFEFTAATVLDEEPGKDWHKVHFMLFDLPTEPGTFSQRILQMQQIVSKSHNPSLKLVHQYKIENRKQLDAELNRLTKEGAEGLMLHHQDALYEDGRSQYLLKLKTFKDDEALVIEHIEGKGKYTGKMGALRVRWKQGIEFKIGTGFSDAIRANPPAIGETITFKYYGLTKNGIPRFASFLRIRPDKTIPSYTAK
ncbi:DNA ligase [Neptunicella marina]|uniref:DNA ligase n=1 Tax=Neptunicella marina TaxID=2125989 RepID=A0A8J6IXE3_9ALTE|nr:DNA ligase [Neptunicella marina]MBC3767247.1 DNA ligase [Neptunicella marina]